MVKSEGAKIINLRTHFVDYPTWSAGGVNQNDALHPTPQGYQLIAAYMATQPQVTPT